MSHKRPFLTHPYKTEIMNPKTNQLISDAPLTAVEKLAVRTMVHALDPLRQASEELGLPIDALTVGRLLEWTRSR